MINKKNIRKWYKMLLHKSNLYVNQPMGSFFEIDRINGYYNDLREKVKKEKVDFGQLPIDESTQQVSIFPIQIYQYGLGAFDCYLETKNKDYLKTFWACVKFAVENVNRNGGIVCFSECKNPYSSMAQGEAASLFARAFILSDDNIYKQMANKCIEFMKKNTMTVRDYGPVLHEFAEQPIVLNGMIFSMFGVYDNYLLTKDVNDKKFWDDCVSSLLVLIDKFDVFGWSLYREDGRVASKFYMKVHIAQLQALYVITNKEKFNILAKKWQKRLKNPFFRAFFFLKKTIQKIKEK